MEASQISLIAGQNWRFCPQLLSRERFGMAEAMIRLSEAEWKVMNVLWEEAPQTITKLTRRFQETTGWTKHTIMTFLKRMEDKGAVYYEAGVRAKLYYPKIERKEAVLQETEEFLERVFDGKMGLMLNTMVEQRALSGKEIAELYEILGRAEASCRAEAEERKEGERQ